jgi:subtilisin family serine protease
MDFQLPPFIVHRRLTAQAIGEELPYSIVDYGLDQIWDETGAGEGVRVGIADTGYPEFHATKGDLVGVGVDAKDFTRSRSGPLDISGHSTHVSGIIAAQFQNGRGIAGAAHKCKMYWAKVLGDNGSGSDQGVSNGIIWLVDQGCHLINCSLGSSFPSEKIREACQYAKSKGSIVFAAAGNSGGGRDTVGYPAHFDELTEAVGAIDVDQLLAVFSSTGLSVDVVGPGVRIPSTYLEDYAELSGTSMATPWITGVCANRLSNELRNGGIVTKTLGDLTALLKLTINDLGKAGRDPEYGMGVPNVREFVRAGLNGHDTPDGECDASFVANVHGREGRFVFVPDSAA